MKYIYTAIISIILLLVLDSCADGNDWGNYHTPSLDSYVPATQGSINGHNYVDLGLSVMWATCNVGAEKPEDYGDYFAWGETKPKSDYSWSTYFDTKDNGNSFTKYNNNGGKTKLDPKDDAATANWGSGWRMPTKAEQDELRTKCTWTWTTQNGVNGYKVTGKNGNSIFLPAAGYRDDSDLYSVGSSDYFWSSTLYSDSSDLAWFVCFYSAYVRGYTYSRYLGFSVRAVCLE